MDYSKAIRIARALADVPQRELASRIGVDASLISMLESGLRKPSLETLEKIARVLDLPFHLFALLGTDRQEAKSIPAEQVQQLAVGLAKLLIQADEDDEHAAGTKARNRKAESAQPKSISVRTKDRRRKAG